MQSANSRTGGSGSKRTASGRSKEKGLDESPVDDSSEKVMESSNPAKRQKQTTRLETTGLEAHGDQRFTAVCRGTKFPKLYVGLRTEEEDHMPLLDKEIEDLYSPSENSLVPTEQEYERFAFSNTEYYTLLGTLTPDTSVSPSPTISRSTIPVPGGGTSSTAVERGISTTAARILAGAAPSAEESMTQTINEAQDREDEVRAVLKRRRLEMLMIGDVMTTTLYLRLKIYCKNRMYYRFEWSLLFKYTIIRDCFGIDVDHTLFKVATRITTSIRTSWQTKILNAAHKIIKGWLLTAAGQKWAKTVIGKSQFILDPKTGVPFARIPAETEFPTQFGSLETARKIFRVIQDGLDWTALTRRNGKLNLAGRFVTNKAKMCLQIEACNCIPWLVLVPARKSKKSGKDIPAKIIYQRPTSEDGSEISQKRSSTVLDHLKLMDKAATALVKCPIEEAYRLEQERKNQPVDPKTPHRMLGLLPPLPRTLHGSGTKKGTYDNVKPDEVPNMIFTGAGGDSDDDDSDTESEGAPRFDENGLLIRDDTESDEDTDEEV
ncbi:hypothetical protein BJ508DRAFT_312207 [Ascobolus immersus RN42]|uniref:Uncharacterized protein n=1 Tax=Ascobolus immersus RN42 TaxID=1160509 RepID=A0A3N4HPC0_ASCIM|nr:hypothetical protein BJ508DRAFT_312207 [Ascobolus immersus RN42]